MADITEDIDELEREELEAASQGGEALEKVVEELGDRSRRRRQFAARVVSLLSQRSPELLVPHIPDLVDALYRPEAQTRWEVLDALTALAPGNSKAVGEAYDGAEAALFDEASSTLRLAAFRFLCTWASSSKAQSKRVWDVLDEAVQCYHGDIEYRDMLGSLHRFASGKLDAEVAAQLAGRLRFDAENSKGGYLKARSAEIYELLCRRFDLEDPRRPQRKASDGDADDEE